VDWNHMKVKIIDLKLIEDLYEPYYHMKRKEAKNASEILMATYYCAETFIKRKKYIKVSLPHGMSKKHRLSILQYTYGIL